MGHRCLCPNPPHPPRSMLGSCFNYRIKTRNPPLLMHPEFTFQWLKSNAVILTDIILVNKIRDLNCREINFYQNSIRFIERNTTHKSFFFSFSLNFDLVYLSPNAFNCKNQKPTPRTLSERLGLLQGNTEILREARSVKSVLKGAENGDLLSLSPSTRDCSALLLSLLPPDRLL